MTTKQEALYRFILMAISGVGGILVAAGIVRALDNTERIVKLETQQASFGNLLEEVRADVKTLLKRIK